MPRLKEYLCCSVEFMVFQDFSLVCSWAIARLSYQHSHSGYFFRTVKMI